MADGDARPRRFCAKIRILRELSQKRRVRRWDQPFFERDAIEQADDAFRDRPKVVERIRTVLAIAKRLSPAFILAGEIDLRDGVPFELDHHSVKSRKRAFGEGRPDRLFDGSLISFR